MDSNQYENLTYRQVESYHGELRAALCSVVESEFASLGIQASEISFAHIQEAESWKNKHKPGRAATWDWKELYHNYHSRGAVRRFDMAISKGNALLGIVYGMLERNRLILKIHAMEANPQIKSIKGKMLDITLFAANVYAKVNQTPEIWLCTPVSEAHVRMYRQKGYEPHYDRFDKCTHLMRKVK